MTPPPAEKFSPDMIILLWSSFTKTNATADQPMKNIEETPRGISSENNFSYLSILIYISENM